jgi:hypothetical protein
VSEQGVKGGDDVICSDEHAAEEGVAGPVGRKVRNRKQPAGGGATEQPYAHESSTSAAKALHLHHLDSAFCLEVAQRGHLKVKREEGAFGSAVRRSRSAQAASRV